MKRFRLTPQTDSFSLEPADAFTRFYEQAHLSVFRYVMVLCAGVQPEAEDVTADAFFKAWQKRKQFSGSEAAALGWVITIARNALIDRRRSESRRPLAADLDEELSDPAVSIEDLLVDQEQLQSILDAIRSLPFQQANILTLHLVLGWRNKAIADHLGLAENTVSVDLRRAMARLQNRLAPQTVRSGSSK